MQKLTLKQGENHLGTLSRGSILIYEICIFIWRSKILWKGSVIKTSQKQVENKKNDRSQMGKENRNNFLCRGSEAENAKPWGRKAYLVFTLLQIGQTESLTDAMFQINNSRKFCWILTLKVKQKILVQGNPALQPFSSVFVVFRKHTTAYWVVKSC